MNAKQYADHTGVDVRKVREWCEAGIIPCERGAKGKRYVIVPFLADEALREYLTSKGKEEKKTVTMPPPRKLSKGSFLDELRKV